MKRSFIINNFEVRFRPFNPTMPFVLKNIYYTSTHPYYVKNWKWWFLSTFSFKIFTHLLNFIVDLTIFSLKITKKKIQTTKSSNFINHIIFFSHLYTCTFATIIYSHNSNKIKCYMVSNHLWTTLLITKQLNFHILLDANNCWMIWLHFSFLSKLTLVTNHSCICN